MVDRISNLTKINISALLFVIVLNSLTIIYRQAYNLIPFYLVPFLIIILLLFIFRKHQKKINAVLMFLLGLIIAFVGNTGNFSGAVFIVFAFHLDPGRNKTIFRLALLTIALAAKGLLVEINAVQILTQVFIHYLCFGYYYVLFTEKKVVTILEIEDQTEQIIDYIREGKTRKEIASLTFLSPAAITKRLNRLRDKQGYKTVDQMLLCLSEKGQGSKKIDRFRVV